MAKSTTNGGKPSKSNFTYGAGNMPDAKPRKKAVVPPARRTGDTAEKPKIKVSQAMIDKIKAEGMTKAIKKAAAGGVSATYMEGVKRLYGARRLASATAATAKTKSTPKSNFTYGSGNAPTMPAKPKSNFTYGANSAPEFKSKKKK